MPPPSNDVDPAYLSQLQGFLDGACKSFYSALAPKKDGDVVRRFFSVFLFLFRSTVCEVTDFPRPVVQIHKTRRTAAAQN